MFKEKNINLNTTGKELENLKNELKSVDQEINRQLEKYRAIEETREDLGYSKAIYKCEDIEAKQLIIITNKVEELENKYDEILEVIKEIRSKDYSKRCIESHNNFINNKYMIRFNDETIYVDNIDGYINSTDREIIIMEYIDYNNTIDKTVNMPKLKTIYKYDDSGGHRYKVNNIINQSNNTNYEEIYTNVDSNISYTSINLLDNNNNEYGYIFDDYICIHKKYSSPTYFTLSKNKDIDKYHINEKAISYNVNNLDTDKLECIYRILTKLKNNKSYKYNIQEIKNMLNIA